MFFNRNFFKVCTDKQMLSCAYAIKEDKEEGNLTRAIEKFGKELVSKSLFGENKTYNRYLQTLIFVGSPISYDYKNNNIDCDNCSRCFNCIGCTSCQDCIGCTFCYRCLDCKDCVSCKECIYCTDCNNCQDCEDCTSCSHCHETYSSKNLF